MSTISSRSIHQYAVYLQSRRRAPATVQKYAYYLKQFAAWLGTRSFTREHFAAWAAGLGCSPRTANGAISAVNGYARWIGRPELKLEFNRIETPYYRPEQRDLKKSDYEALLMAASSAGRERLYLTVMTIAGLGIRVSELPFVTVRAVQSGEASITNKGKTRRVVIPKRLRDRLLRYCRAQNIADGPVFVTRSGKPLGRRQIWTELKTLARRAHVALEKVFPHNLRHLFAVLHYRAHKDIFGLSRILGHSSVKTTQLYLVTGSEVFARQMEVLGLIQ